MLKLYRDLLLIFRNIFLEYPIASFIYTERQSKHINTSPYRFYKTLSAAIIDFKKYCLEKGAKKLNNYEFKLGCITYELAVHNVGLLSFDYFLGNLSDSKYIHLAMYIENDILYYVKQEYYYKKITRTKYKLTNNNRSKIANIKMDPLTQIDNLFNDKYIINLVIELNVTTYKITNLMDVPI